MLFRSLSKAIEKKPGFDQARLLMANIYYQEGDLYLAEDNVKKVILNLPNHYNANILLGNIFLANKTYDPARNIYNRMIELAPKNPTAHYRLGILDRAEKQYGPAITHFEDALELNPRLMDVFSSLISVYALEKKYDPALNIIEDHLKKTADTPVITSIILNLKGNILLSTKAFPEARQAYTLAIEKNPEYVSPYLTLAKVLASEKNYDQAVNVYLDLIAKRPDLESPHSLLGTLYEQQEKMDLAEIQYVKALEINPDYIPAVNNLAYLYAEQNRELNKALDLARKAKKLMGSQPAIMDTLGWVYYKKQLYDSAAAEFAGCIEKDPNNPIFHYHLGLAYNQLGKANPAKESLLKALDLQPDFKGSEDARKLLSHE